MLAIQNNIDQHNVGVMQVDMFDGPVGPKQYKRKKYGFLYSIIAKRKAPTVKELKNQYLLFIDVLETDDNILDVPQVWTRDDILTLQYYMLHKHINYVLDRRTGNSTAQEAWSWILSDSKNPFSFITCIQSLLEVEEGDIYTDITFIRNQIYYQAKRMKSLDRKVATRKKIKQQKVIWLDFCLVE
jgi:hypothetical protein